jgi:hypothetical protein
MNHLFISYARDDLEKVEKMVQFLSTEGIEVWWDRRIVAGSDFQNELTSALQNASCVLVVWSKYSVVSSFVRDEAAEALSCNKLLPVILEAEVKPPLGFRQIQSLDLSKWSGKADSPDLKILKESIAMRAPDLIGRRGMWIELVKKGDSLWLAKIDFTEVLPEGAEVILMVGSSASSEEIIEKFWLNTTIYAFSDFDAIMHSHLPGIMLEHLPYCPKEIPFQAGMVYFRLKPTSLQLNKINTDRGLLIESKNLPDLELQLFCLI